ncbi:MAG: alpha-galactosidase, partial [Clostridia bacterium]|nr:alpha-galactosidase [Clostridia bacterium]
DLYRAHPEWALAAPGRVPLESRQQLVLDMGNPAVVDYLTASFEACFKDVPIDYFKWDMNRHLSPVYSNVLPPERQGEASFRHMCGVYELFRRLRAMFPNAMIENCSGGGGRYDLGMSLRPDRHERRTGRPCHPPRLLQGAGPHRNLQARRQRLRHGPSRPVERSGRLPACQLRQQPEAGQRALQERTRRLHGCPLHEGRRHHAGHCTGRCRYAHFHQCRSRWQGERRYHRYRLRYRGRRNLPRTAVPH